MLTSCEDIRLMTEAFEARANDYLTKPIDRGELVARVRASLPIPDSRRAPWFDLAVIIAGLSLLATAALLCLW